MARSGRASNGLEGQAWHGLGLRSADLRGVGRQAMACTVQRGAVWLGRGSAMQAVRGQEPLRMDRKGKEPARQARKVEGGLGVDRLVRDGNGGFRQAERSGVGSG